MKRIVFLILFVFSFVLINAQTQSIKVYFLYGSKPAKCCKATEKKRFGGIHGGHVSIGVDDDIIGFSPKKGVHLFEKKNDCNSHFHIDKLNDFKKDSVGNKYAVISIPVTKGQYDTIQMLHHKYIEATPYDYAFIGMRCASASYDVLSQIGIFKKHSKTWMKYQIFYPRRLRKRALKLAKKKGYHVDYQNGKSSRKWERD